jgi:hypothetical protein
MVKWQDQWEWSNRGNDGMGKAVMAYGMVGWQGQNGQMAQMATYVPFMVLTNNDDDTNDTLIVYSIDPLTPVLYPQNPCLLGKGSPCPPLPLLTGVEKNDMD